MRRAIFLTGAVATALAVVGSGLAARTLILAADPPSAVILSAPVQPTAVTRAVFAFTGEATAYSCRVDGRGWTPCTSPVRLQPLRTGRHTFDVSGLDADGVPGQPASYSWNIAVARPAAPTLTGLPLVPTSSTGATFTFLPAVGTKAECKLDTAAWRSCRSPVTLTALASGPHVFQLRAKNTRGAVSPPGSFAWTIGRNVGSRPQALPTPNVTSGPRSQTTARKATFVFHTRRDLQLSCSLDTASFAPCQSPRTMGPLPLGAHVFRVRSTSSHGVSAANARRWRIGPRPPRQPALASAPLSPTGSPSALFAFVSRDALGYRCTVDGGPAHTCSSPWTATGTLPGEHRFEVRALGRSGMLSPPAAYSWLVDGAGLDTTVTFTASPPATTTETTATFAFTGPEGAAYECSLDGAAFTACASPVVLAGLTVGQRSFAVRALLGTLVGDPVTYTWTITSAGGGGGGGSTPLANVLITGDVPGQLVPGSSAALPLTLTNPNSVSVVVSGLVVSVRPTSSKPGCSGSTNLLVTQSTAASSATVTVPAGTSVTLPTGSATAPAVTMPNLSSNQDACKGASFTLDYAANVTEGP